MIVGTAGHIDHGKTSLVRTLTGVDTDRLPEEKRRGISIELGYAYQALPGGEVLGFIDVPGHERFIQTMLAGATGIDFALLVVAADDGVMPQTREHLDILCLLDVRRGAVAVTKIDRVEASRVEAVVAEVAALLHETPLAGVPIFPVCTVDGTGIDALRECLTHAAGEGRHEAERGAFRLAVDRSFVLPGIGTVVTGTVFSGQVRVGDILRIAPAGPEVRVRNLHAQDRKAVEGTVGQRCALNIAGAARDEVNRGDWVVAPASVLRTDRFDARLRLVPGAKNLRSGTPVHLHCGAAHTTGRIVVLDRDDVTPQMPALVQLVLHEPLAVWHGDRFVVRDASASTTIGGGVVIDPLPPARYRRSPERLRALEALDDADAPRALASLVALSPHGVDLRRFALGFGLVDVEWLVEHSTAKRIRLGDYDCLIAERHWDALLEAALEALAKFHEAQPDDMGPDRGRLRRLAFPRLPEPAAAAVVDQLIGAARVGQSGSWLHLPDHALRLSEQERRLAERVRPRLVEARFDPPLVREIAKDLRQPESLVRATLARLARRGEVYAVVRDLYYDASIVDELAAIAADLQAKHGAVRAAQFRDAIGLGRKRAILILEFFDRIGYTRRIRDDHVVRATSPLAARGPATPIRHAPS